MEKSLANWVNTFPHISKRCDNLSDLGDGIVLSEILVQIIPEFFDGSSIKKAEDNPFLKLANVKKLVSVLLEYYQERLGLSMPDMESIDASAIAKEGNVIEIVKVIQLILGIAVECENKVTYIQNIMQMDPSSQRELMILIEQIINQHQQQKSFQSLEQSEALAMDNDEEFLKELDFRSVKQTEKEIQKWKEDYEQLQQEYFNLSELNETLTKEKEKLTSAVKDLEETLRMKETESPKADVLNDSNLITSQMERDNQWREQQLLKSEIEDKEAIIGELKKKVEELSKIAQEARQQRDELDILREQAAKVPQLEDRLKKLQKKAESVPDLRKQLKELEQQGEQYLKSKIELEENAKKFPILKSQLDKYKDQVTELTAEKTSLQSLLSEKESELMKLREERKATTFENTRLQSQLQTLEMNLERLKQEHDDKLLEGEDEDHYGESIADIAAKEKLFRLEMENKSDSAHLEKIADLENKLDDSLRLNAKYAADIEQLRKNIRSLEGSGGSSPEKDRQFLELQEAHKSLQADHEAALSTVKQLQLENKKHLEEINNLLKSTKTTSQMELQVSEYSTKLKEATEKINQLSADKAKLEGYLRTAKTMIREEKAKTKTMRDQELQKIQKDYDQAIQALTSQLNEKKKEIASHQRVLEESKEASQREIKLISSALYEVGLELQRLKAPKPDMENTAPKSLLAQKRRDLDQKL